MCQADFDRLTEEPFVLLLPFCIVENWNTAEEEMSRYYVHLLVDTRLSGWVTYSPK